MIIVVARFERNAVEAEFLHQKMVQSKQIRCTGVALDQRHLDQDQANSIHAGPESFKDLKLVSLDVNLERVDVLHERLAEQVGGLRDKDAFLPDKPCAGCGTQVILMDRQQ